MYKYSMTHIAWPSDGSPHSQSESATCESDEDGEAEPEPMLGVYYYIY